MTGIPRRDQPSQRARSPLEESASTTETQLSGALRTRAAAVGDRSCSRSPTVSFSRLWFARFFAKMIAVPESSGTANRSLSAAPRKLPQDERAPHEPRQHEPEEHGRAFITDTRSTAHSVHAIIPIGTRGSRRARATGSSRRERSIEGVGLRDASPIRHSCSRPSGR